MKRLGIFICTCFFLYIVYYDINFGTLPMANSEDINSVVVSTDSMSENVKDKSFQTIKISAGDTVLSIVEKINKDYQITSIEDVIKDFEALNPNTKAEQIQIGQEYHFPLYSK